MGIETSTNQATYYNTFKINSAGRPEGTVETDKGVVHYTCNSPNDEVLKKMGIKPIGENFKIDKLANNEVLLIPDSLFESKGKRVSTVEAEAILRDLTEEYKDKKF